MADNIIKFKPITNEDVFKGLDKNYSALQTASGSSLTWYYVERDALASVSELTDDMKNLFHSFGISREDEEDWFKVFNVEDWYNATRMIVATIPQSSCGSYIDGSTVRLNVPTGETTGDYTTFYGSTFEGYPDPITGKQIAYEYSNSQYGGAYCYLFANSAGDNALTSAQNTTDGEHPYTGTIDGGYNPNTGEASFDQDGVTIMTPHLSATNWENGDDGRDVPYGIALLERGIFVIFDCFGRSNYINNSPISGTSIWSENSAGVFVANDINGAQNTDGNDRKGISFTGTVADDSARLTYRTITQEYKNVYFCHAGQAEFNSTSNHTYNSKKAYFRPEEADSLWITEIALCDDDDVVLAYAKLSEPVEKNKLETLTFKVELSL